MVEPTHLKNMLVKLDHFPRDRDEYKKSLKPPPSLNLFLEKSFRNTWSFNHLNNFFPQKGQIHQIIYQYIQKTSQQKLTGFTTRKNSCTVPSPVLFAPFYLILSWTQGGYPKGIQRTRFNVSDAERPQAFSRGVTKVRGSPTVL